MGDQTPFFQICRAWIILLLGALVSWGIFWQPKVFVVVGVIAAVVFTIVAVIRLVEYYFN